MTWRRCLLPGAAALLLAWAGLKGGEVVLREAFPLDLARVQTLSRAVTDSEGRLLRAVTAPDQRWRFAVESGGEAVSPLYRAMLLAYEDKRFRTHGGVDPLAALRALWQVAESGRVVSGASTLTMQAARLLEPRPRGLWAKAVEVFRARQLEARFGKAEILSIYLTLAPFGGNLEGVEAASRAYFGKGPRHLTPDQAALLVALPQAPSLTRPDRFPAAAKRARNKVLRRVAAAGIITADQLRDALDSPLRSARLALPFTAPHLAERLLAGSAGRDLLASSLDLDLQQAAARVLRRGAQRLGSGVSAAALIVETQTGRVRAYLGSADYFDAAAAGMVDMVTAARSPGSTLKPFIYGLAFEGGIAHPDSLIADRPERFGGYAPSNFDGSFHGELTLREALRRSLNLPAVALLRKVGPLRLDRRLRAAGADLTYPSGSGRPGLPLALGGVGISLEDLTRLYLALARQGRPLPLRFTAAAPAQSEPLPPLLSASAAWHVAEVLEGTPRPSGHRLAPAARNGQRGAIAYKTGTAYGFRDAWAVGFDSRHTIAVWAGRPDGTPCMACVGITAAAPLLFQLFDLLPPAPSARSLWPRPEGLLRAVTSDLPPSLRRFGPAPERPLTPSLEIDFPPDGAALALTGALPLAARGGQAPFTWLVDGVPLAAGLRRAEVQWLPNAPGYATLEVLDASGQSARASVELLQP
ncbi:MAG: penicillin-binding protein 1C [Rhodospirillales bacterium]